MRRATVVLVVAALLPSARGGERADPPFPMPEPYLGNRDPDGYAKAAGKFLDEHADSPYAPRVAFDLLMVATVYRNQALAEKVRSQLLLLKPSSLHAAYLRSTMKEAKDYREILSAEMDKRVDRMPRALAALFARALRAGLGQFGPKLLDDDPFLLKCCLLAADAGDAELGKHLRAHLDSKDLAASFRPVVAVCLAKDKGAADKAVALHALAEDATAALLVRYFLGKLPEAERSAPRLRRIMAESLLTRAKYRDALATLAKLPPEQETAQTLFWRASCHVALRETAKALDLLAQLQTKHPDSPWRPVARQYAAAVKDMGRNLDACGTALFDAVTQIKRGVKAFEAELEYRPSKQATRAIRAYVGVLTGKESVEVLVRDNDVVILALRVSKQGTTFYDGQEPVIYHFTRGGALPTPKFDLRRNPDGTYNLSTGAVLSTSFGQAAKSGGAFLDSPVLASQEAVEELLAYTARTHGWVPLPAVLAKGVATYEWVKPSPRRPELHRVAYSIREDNTFASAQFAAFRTVRLRYSTDEPFPLAPPPWPKLKTVTKDQFDPTLFMRLMMNLVRRYVPQK